MSLLSERQLKVLVQVVERFNLSGEPVGSTAVSRSEGISVSSATVRNVMAELEGLGLLHQPHTSAGRVPTASGMRLYVDYLVATGQRAPNGGAPEWLASLSELEADDVSQLARSAGVLVSQLSHLTSLVSTPGLAAARLRDVQLSWLSEHRILVVLITEDGRVFNRVVRMEEPVERNSIVWMRNYLSELVTGRSLQDVRRRVRRELAASESRYRSYMRRALALSQQVLDLATGAELYVEGRLNVLDFSELAHDIARVRDVLRALEDKERVLDVLDRICEARRVQTLIGSELDLDLGDDLSLIACGYYRDGEQVGLVGVLGPLRMNYARIIPLVEHTARMLSKDSEELNSSS
ncbi:heat-inducible transcription repressor HrcA [Lujinxingia litoralis]|uniref:Heat-inducible transcription repressor HrcA n=1 Tax=Lujinxingia litoralis TaxID=2211119 RepID=A0A328CE92_9DELT|nr:heat-inducible transcriptional repressor HrcA [Lujinxingia litoralis]RAL25193.1 heat-inducible transcription repressor HrcA [Lujinxingia litoralis]